MRDINKEMLAMKSGKINIEYPEGNGTVGAKKVARSSKTEKNYKVTVTYIELPEVQAKIKRAIVESIMKKSYRDKD